jgi:glutamate formiminotransferase/formiminotetrahydrofolate cyclodeaminase
VYLNSDDVSIARKIGKAVRHSSGGLRYVKGLGMLVDGQAQVSMNLTNFKGTPIHRVVEMIRSEAARYGTTTTHSELIGMIPQQALIDAAVWYLQLDMFSEDQILENKIAAELQTTGGDNTFLDDLASNSPTPGGGSAAAYAAAMAAGLAAMVARVTIGKKKYTGVETEMQAVVARAEDLRTQFTQAVAQDAEAFNGVMAAFRLAKGTDKEQEMRNKAIQHATLHAAQVPLGVVEKVVELLPLIRTAAEKGNANAITDAGSAAALAQAALSGAGMNVRINLGGLEDLTKAAEITATLSRNEAQAESILVEIQKAVRQRGQIEAFSL